MLSTVLHQLEIFQPANGLFEAQTRSLMMAFVHVALICEISIDLQPESSFEEQDYL